MSETNATLVVTAIPNADAMEDMQAYSTDVLPLLMGHGGSLILSVSTIIDVGMFTLFDGIAYE